MQMQAVTLGINGKFVSNMQELQTVLDGLAAGAKVTINYKSKGKDMVIEGLVK